MQEIRLLGILTSAEEGDLEHATQFGLLIIAT